MSKQIKIIIPDAGPINTLAAADLLYLLMAPEQATLVIIESVMIEIISNSRKLADFMTDYSDRIEVVRTSICIDDAEKRARGEKIGRGRGDLAVADFLMNFVDDAAGNSPALVIYEDKKLARLHEAFEVIGDNSHFITTAAYLRKLEHEGLIDSFEETWGTIVSANHSADPKFNREPNPVEKEDPSNGGSRIFRIK